MIKYFIEEVLSMDNEKTGTDIIFEKLKCDNAKLKLSRNGLILDRNYLARAGEMLRDAREARHSSDAEGNFTGRDPAVDYETAVKCRPRRGNPAVKIIILIMFAFGLLSLLLPLDPFLSKAPICGAFFGIGGIILFPYLLSRMKKNKKAELYYDILEAYGTDDPEEIPVIADKKNLLDKSAQSAEETALKFIRYAYPDTAGFDEADEKLNELSRDITVFETARTEYYKNTGTVYE